MEVKFKKLKPNAIIPTYAKDGDVGMDLYSCMDYEKRLYRGERFLVPTGLAIELPKGYEAQVRPRSGLSIKNGLTVLNAPATIDEGFRGEIMIILINLDFNGEPYFQVEHGQRLAQLVIKPFEQAEVVEVSELSQSERGENGLGSTGIR